MPQCYTLAEIAEQFSFRLLGCSTAEADKKIVHGVATLASADESHLSFFTSAVYRDQLQNTRAAAVIIRENAVEDCPVPCLIVDNPYLAYAKVSGLFSTLPPTVSGIHASAVIDPTATIATSASIGPQCVVAAGAVIGEHVVLNAGCSIGANSAIGAGSYLHANVTVYHGVAIGEDAIIHSGAVIGADGFGFAPDFAGEAKRWQKIHQLGGVVVGNRVEIGANTCIDRGALDDTVIGNGVIIDNLVQIAHNVKIGDFTAIAACTGIAGSTEIGQHCTIAGAVGIAGHLRITDRVHITAKTLVTGSILEPGSYSSGTALMETPAWRKSAVRFSHLDALFQRVRKLESHHNKF